MLLSVLNAAGVAQTEIVRGQETLTNASGTLAESDTWQSLVPANLLRSGFVMQNLGTSGMSVCEAVDPDDPTQPAPGATFWNVLPGAYWPPPGFPTTTGAMLVQGAAGDSWTGRDY